MIVVRDTVCRLAAGPSCLFRNIRRLEEEEGEEEEKKSWDDELPPSGD
jgi:hypothetical protein